MYKELNYKILPRDCGRQRSEYEEWWANFPSVKQALKTVIILVVLLGEHSFWHIVNLQILAF